MAGDGELAQLVERCDRTAEVRGSSPLFSTALAADWRHRTRPWPRTAIRSCRGAPCGHLRLLPFPLPSPMAIPWTPDAEARLKEVPFFVRPAVRRRIEKLAAEEGLDLVDEAMYDRARAAFGQS